MVLSKTQYRPKHLASTISVQNIVQLRSKILNSAKDSPTVPELHIKIFLYSSQLAQCHLTADKITDSN